MHRGWMDNPILRDDPKRIAAWIWLIESACFKPTRRYVNGEITTLHRGQFSTSIRSLAKQWEKWGFTERGVRTFISCLKSDTMIDTQNDTRGMIITICNYELYQIAHIQNDTPTDTQNDTPTTHQRHTNDTHKKESNKGNKGNKVNIKPPIPPLIIPDWLPEIEWMAFVEMRTKIRKPLTEHAKRLAIKRLEELRARGHPPDKVLQQSTLHDYQGLFPLKQDDENGKNKRFSAHDGFDERDYDAAAAAFRAGLD